MLARVRGGRNAQPLLLGVGLGVTVDGRFPPPPPTSSPFLFFPFSLLNAVRVGYSLVSGFCRLTFACVTSARVAGEGGESLILTAV